MPEVLVHPFTAQAELCPRVRVRPRIDLGQVVAIRNLRERESGKGPRETWFELLTRENVLSFGSRPATLTSSNPHWVRKRDAGFGSTIICKLRCFFYCLKVFPVPLRAGRFVRGASTRRHAQLCRNVARL